MIAISQLATHLPLVVTFPDGCDPATQSIVIGSDDAVVGGAFVDYPGDVVGDTYRVFPQGSTAYLQNGVHTFWDPSTSPLTVVVSCTVDGEAVSETHIVRILPSVMRNDLGYVPNADVAALLAYPFTRYCSNLFEDLKVRLSGEVSLSGRLFFNYAADTPIRAAFGDELDEYRDERYVARTRLLTVLHGFNPDVDRFMGELEQGGVSSAFTGILRELFLVGEAEKLSGICAGLIALSKVGA